jgi:hypothetical protein
MGYIILKDTKRMSFVLAHAHRERERRALKYVKKI